MLLSRQSPAVSAQRSVAPHHSVTRNHNGDPILAVRTFHRPLCVVFQRETEFQIVRVSKRPPQSAIPATTGDAGASPGLSVSTPGFLGPEKTPRVAPDRRSWLYLYQAAQSRLRFRVVRLLPDDGPELLHGFGVSPQLRQRLRQFQPRGRVVWVITQQRVEFRGRVGGSPFPYQKQGQVEPRIGGIRFSTKRFAELLNRRRRPAGGRECHSDVKRRPRIVRAQP